jgi:hypothetical protein
MRGTNAEEKEGGGRNSKIQQKKRVPEKSTT